MEEKLENSTYGYTATAIMSDEIITGQLSHHNAIAKLFELIKERKVNDVIKIVEANPSNALLIDPSNGWSTLHYACDKKLKSLVGALLKNNANVNAVNNSFCRPIHICAMHGDVEIAQILIAQGADLHETDQYGYTPLHWAVVREHAPFIDLLLSKGVNINTKIVEEFRTPLHDAAIRSNWPIVLLLLKFRANPNAKDKDGYTPFHHAAVTGGISIIKEFLYHGADFTVKTKNATHLRAWRQYDETRTPLELLRVSQGDRFYKKIKDELKSRNYITVRSLKSFSEALIASSLYFDSPVGRALSSRDLIDLIKPFLC